MAIEFSLIIYKKRFVGVYYNDRPHKKVTTPYNRYKIERRK